MAVAVVADDCAVVTTQPEHHPDLAVALLEAEIYRRSGLPGM
jgi:hypothetical protein